MRQIKFRARIKENGKPKMFYQNNQHLISFLRRVSNFLVKDAKDRNELEKSLDSFTGSLDKNKKEIYEGDIVIVGIKKEVREIFYENGAFYAVTKNHITESDHLVAYYYPIEIEVIGNIYENGNLIDNKCRSSSR